MTAIAEFTFREQLVLNLVGPLFTVLLGTLVIGFAANWITRQANERREDHALRGGLITDVTEASSALYLATQHFGRAKRELPEQLQSFREALDAQYLESRQAGMVLEHLLGLHFADPRPRQLMHRVMDLLTVRYFQLVGKEGASEGLRKANAGDEHTGLSAEQLASPERVIGAFHASLAELITAVADGKLEIPRANP